MLGQDRLLFLTIDAKPAFNSFCDSGKAYRSDWDKSERVEIGAKSPIILGVHLVRKAPVKAKNLRFQRIQFLARGNAMTTDLQKPGQNPVASNRCN